MAKSWAGLNVQVIKVGAALEKLSPPEPEDEFESIRRDVIQSIKKLHEFTADRAAAGDTPQMEE